jgi:hypothetical protein
MGVEGVGWIHISQDEGLVASSCERGIEPSGALKGGEYFEEHLKKKSAPWS